MATQELTPNPIPPLQPEVDEHQQWLIERRKGIGGSDVHNLFPDVSKYGCPAALFDDKTGKAHDFGRTQDEMDILRRGNLLENVVAGLYAEYTGRQIFRATKPYVSKEYPFMRVNIDRRIKSEPNKGPGVLECKTANAWVMREILEQGLPPAYIMQLQHALAVTGYQWGSFAVYEAGQGKFIHFDIERDEQMIAILLDREMKFWADVETNRRPDPLPDLKDARCKKCQFRKSCRGEQFAQMNAQIVKEIGKVQYEDDDSPVLAQKVIDLKQAKAVIEEWEGIAERITDEIKEAIGDRQAVRVPDAGIAVVWKEQKGAVRWDTRALEADHPEMAEKYKKPSAPTRPFKMFDIEAS
jgi:predicted phage-related endonuclease